MLLRSILGGWTILGLMAAPAGSSELRVAIAGDIKSFVPAVSTEPGTAWPLNHVYEGLVAWTANGAVAPMLAEALPQVSDDGRIYTFKLRSGVQFHDGTPLTAEAVVGSWEFLLKPTTSWSCRSYFDGSGRVKITGVKVTAPLQVAFMLERPAGEFLTQMARADCASGGIMAPAVVAAAGKSDKPIGTGPFAVSQIRPGRDTTMVRFEGYKPRTEPMDGFAGKKEALVDKLTWTVIPDTAATYAALASGAVDVWTVIEMRYASQLKQATGVEVVSSPISSINTLPIHTSDPVMSKPAFRQALNHAIDRKQMTEALTEGRATPNSALIPSSSEFHKVTRDNDFAYDPDKAKALLKEAGYSGQKLTIVTNKNYAGMFETGVMVQAFLQTIGVNAEVQVLDFPAQLAKYYRGDYDLMTFNYAPTLDPALLIDRVTGSRAANPSKVWDNEEARKLANELIGRPVAERLPIYEAIHTAYMKDPALLIWASSQMTSAFRDKVKGYKPWPGETPRFWGVSVQ